MKALKVAIDPGHGGEEPGAVYRDLLEKNCTLSISQALCSMLEAAGFKVLLTRQSDKYVSLGHRCRLANQWSADLFVSIHCNSALQSGPEGIVTFFYAKEATANGALPPSLPSSRGQALARRIQEQLTATFPDHKDLDVRASRGLYVLKNTDMPAVLVETEFINNPRGYEFFTDRENLARIAGAIFRGVEQYAKQLEFAGRRRGEPR